uniref:ATP synthase complex subunit 8 n=1 Tax=Cleridae sp. 2 ACP-2013 TaxID=1434447 RepID=A0A3G3FXA2_9CUCU|nr:ATP synthase F0 subunit 8 [Cleridae sp. 2 ACP-2013]
MPQMSPMNWILLFIFFFSLFLIINSIIFFINTVYPPLSSKLTKINKINWKW